LTLAGAGFEKRKHQYDIIDKSHTCGPIENLGLFLVRTRIDSIGNLLATTGDAVVAEFQP
jgi:hypothetical protein